MDGLRRRILASTDIGGDDFVDLDLPSGALWARGNIVSDGRGGYKIGKATDYGAYFLVGVIQIHTFLQMVNISIRTTIDLIVHTHQVQAKV